MLPLGMISNTYQRGILIFCTLLLSVVAWIVLLHYISPTELVERIGVQNGYLVMFLVATFGGVSSFTGVSYVATVLTLSAGGLNPFLLALSSGLGITISDSLFFWLGRHADSIISSSWLRTRIDRIATWLGKRRPLTVAMFIYLYTAFTPLPNDILTGMLGLTKQPYRLVIVALTLGNATFAFLLATLGGKISDFFPAFL